MAAGHRVVPAESAANTSSIRTRPLLARQHSLEIRQRWTAVDKAKIRPDRGQRRVLTPAAMSVASSMASPPPFRFVTIWRPSGHIESLPAGRRTESIPTVPIPCLLSLPNSETPPLPLIGRTSDHIRMECNQRTWGSWRCLEIDERPQSQTTEKRTLQDRRTPLLPLGLLQQLGTSCSTLLACASAADAGLAQYLVLREVRVAWP